MCSSAREILRKISSEQESTMVVISGDAIMAGSRWSFVAISGRTPPITFAMTTVQSIAIATVSPISSCPGY